MSYMTVLRVSQKLQTLHIVSHIILTSDRCNTNKNCVNAALRPPQKLAAVTTIATVYLLP